MALKYWLIIISLGVAWGTSFLFNEVLLREIGPLTVSFGRTGLGALGCWLYVIVTRKRFQISFALAIGMISVGALNFAIPFAIYPISQQYVTSGVAGIVNATTPVMVVLVSHFLPGGEKATMPKIIGVVLGLIGVSFIAYPAVGNNSEFYAILFLLFAPLCYAFAFNLLRKYKEMDPAVIAALALTGGTLIIAPISIWTEGIPTITQTETWASFAMIGFVLTSAAFIISYWLLAKVGATNMSIITFIAPISTVSLGAIILGETLQIEQVLGMAVIFCAMIVMDGRLLQRIRQR